MATQPSTGHGLTSAQIRRYHHRIVLQRLRQLGEASKADLARAAALTNTAVGEIVSELMALGLIHVVGKRYEGQRGQPATILRLQSNGAYGIGVRLDRNRIETALVDLGGRIVAIKDREGPLPVPEKALDIVQTDIEALVAVADGETPGRVAGVGIGRPFNLGAWLGKLDLKNSNLRAWDTFDFAGALADRVNLDVHEENDGTAAAIGELFHGHGRDGIDFVYFFIGPAIGGGMVLDGDYRRGPRANAGDVAMIPVEPSRLASALPVDSRRDILLSRASVSSLLRHLRHHGAKADGLDDLQAAMARHPQAVDEWLADCVDALVDPIMTASAFLDVPSVVIDGDLGPDLLSRLVESLRGSLERAAPEAREPPALRIGSFGSVAGAVGAASLPLFIHFAPRPQVLTRPDSLSPIRGAENARAP
ncbi:MAG: ROK family protein [Labrys sp. (in: a-proteobacteria)]